MAMLETNTKTEQITEVDRSSRGGFFIPGLNQLRLGSRPFQNSLLVDKPDHSGASFAVREVVSSGTILANLPAWSEYAASLKVGLEEGVTALNSLTKAHHAGWLIRARQAPQAARVATDALVADYGVDCGVSADFSHVLIIPGEKITAAGVLSHHRFANTYDPVMDLRIQTSIDDPVSYYKGPGDVSEVPSSGKWFRFPLDQIDLRLFD